MLGELRPSKAPIAISYASGGRPGQIFSSKFLRNLCFRSTSERDFLSSFSFPGLKSGAFWVSYPNSSKI